MEDRMNWNEWTGRYYFVDEHKQSLWRAYDATSRVHGFCLIISYSNNATIIWKQKNKKKTKKKKKKKTKQKNKRQNVIIKFQFMKITRRCL